MAIDLKTTGAVLAPTPDTFRSGWGDAALNAGQRLVIETSPHGDELLNELCPVGKRLRVTLFVKIIEETV